MPYQVQIADAALKSLRRIPIPDRRRIDRVIRALADAPRPPGVKKLEGNDDLYRVRSGDYRVVYAIRDHALLILIVRIAHRRDVYRGL